jgi:RNA polymerase sigma-70 factor (ECF subfamily)
MHSDEELMSAVAGGDEAALAMLIGRHAPRLRAYLFRHSGNREDADDLLQETWVRVARSARRFDPTRRFRSWLYGIATNLARDLFRRRATSERALRELAMRPRVEPEVGPIDSSLLRERITRLPERMRAVLLLRYFEGMNEAEMAETLGIPRGTVKSRLHAALCELRREYEVLA